MKKKLSIIMCLVMVICITTTGCTTFNNFKNAFFSKDNGTVEAKERTIKIGVYEPLTGVYKAHGDEEKIGIELAHELYPEVAGKKVELIYADNQSEMEAGKTAIQELVAQKPSVVLGSYGETVTLVAGDAIKANSIPAISITSTNPLITVNNKYYFCATFAEEKQGDALANFAYEHGKSTAAIVKITGDDVATATAKRFSAKMTEVTENSGSVVGTFEIQSGAKDYTDVINGIKDSGAQAVLLLVSPTVAKDFLDQAEKAKFTAPLFLGMKSWNDDKFLSYAESKKLDIGYATDFAVDVQSTEMSKIFVEAYKAKYGEDAEPTEATAVAFDAYIMALEAIQNAHDKTMELDSESVASNFDTDAASKGARNEWEEAQETGIPSGKAIRDSLANLNNFEGASGLISFSGGNEAAKNIVVRHISDGKRQNSIDVVVENTEK